MPKASDKENILKACTRFLSHSYPQTPYQVLSALAETTDPDLAADRYGQGELIERFEADIARLLGKEAAVFMPSGTMCQQIALRILTQRRGNNNVAFHPTSHLELHEESAYQRMHNLNGILLGTSERMLTINDLKAVREPLGALCLELPQREIGGQLPSWEELNEIIDWARERTIPVHLDGARLWECKPFYGREYAEMAALFETVYVSFYKVLGGIAGAILAGPQEIIDESRVWQRRHGGNLVHLYPYVLSAQKGLSERLGRIETYHAKAKEIAAVLTTLPEIEILPDPPQTNMMHVFIRGELDRLSSNALTIARETGVLLFSRLVPTSLPTYQKFELVVGEATLDLTAKGIADLFQRLFNEDQQ